MDPTPVRLVCFDLGGVLVRICRGWAEACERAGVPVRLDADHADTWRRIHVALSDYEVGNIDSAAMIARLVAASNGHDAEHIERIIDAWLIDLYDGVAELIRAIHAAGVPTACLSNTNDWHWRIMDSQPRFAALRTLRHRFASHLARCRKPEPAIFQHLEDRLSLTGEAIVFFDDLPENIEAAAERGWRGFVVDPAADPVQQMTGHLRGLGVLR